MYPLVFSVTMLPDPLEGGSRMAIVWPGAEAVAAHTPESGEAWACASAAGVAPICASA